MYNNNNNNKKLFTEVEVNSGGYLPSREARRASFQGSLTIHTILTNG